MDPTPVASLPSRARALAPWLLLSVWAVLLCTSSRLAPGAALPAVSLEALRSPAGLLALAGRVAAWGALEAFRFVPLGLLAVLALPDRERRLARTVLVLLPALALALAGAALAVVSARAAPGGPPVHAFLLPAAGCALGVAGGLAWRRGVGSLLALGAALALLLPLGAAVTVRSALEPQASVAAPQPLAAADRSRFHALLRSAHPAGQPAQEGRSLRLLEADLERLLAWGASPRRPWRAAVALEGTDRAAVVASLRVPRTSLWLNARAALHLRVDAGRVTLALPALSLGGWSLPPSLLEPLGPALVRALEADARLAKLLPALQALHLEPGALSARWSGARMPWETLGELARGEAGTGTLRAALGAHLGHLAGALGQVPAGAGRFGAALEAAFAFARQRSVQGSAVEENRAALVALGVVLGHERLAWVAGAPLDAPSVARLVRLRPGTTVRGRADWVRHFGVSAALTALAAVAPSDALGLFKEERDALGGSGFSFGDLLADRAGTTFAEVALRDEPSARTLQARLAAGFDLDAFFPEAEGLPEGIAAAELESRYGGVGGPLYRRYAEEIERRLVACAAYAP